MLEANLLPNSPNFFWMRTLYVVEEKPGVNITTVTD